MKVIRTQRHHLRRTTGSREYCVLVDEHAEANVVYAWQVVSAVVFDQMSVTEVNLNYRWKRKRIGKMTLVVVVVVEFSVGMICFSWVVNATLYDKKVELINTYNYYKRFLNIRN